MIDDPEISTLISTLKLESDADNTLVFVYDQKYIWNKMYDSWCPSGVERHQVTLNDRLRIFGILLHQDHRDDINRITAGVQSREELDDPSLQVKQTWNRFAKSFNNPTFRISHPDKYHDITNYQIFDPNESERIVIPRDGVWIKRIFTETMKPYRVSLTKWNMGTGGGPDHPPDYFCVEDRDEKYFQDYDKTRGGLLCWIFMHDKKLGFLLDAKNQSLPDSLQVETGGKKNNSDKRKRQKTPSPDDQLKRICTAISESTNNLLQRKNAISKNHYARPNSDEQNSEASELTCQNEQREDMLLAKAQRIEDLIESINKSNRLTGEEKKSRIITLDQMLSRAYNEMSVLSQKHRIISNMSMDEELPNGRTETKINFESTDLLEDHDKDDVRGLN